MRRTRIKPSRPKRLTPEELEQARLFKQVAWDNPCAVCSPGTSPGPWFRTSHHVVYEQHLEGDQRWDRRNALSLCQLHHARHHSANEFRVSFFSLTDQNLEFARELMPDSWLDYLRRRYDDVPEAV